MVTILLCLGAAFAWLCCGAAAVAAGEFLLFYLALGGSMGRRARWVLLLSGPLWPLLVLAVAVGWWIGTSGATFAVFLYRCVTGRRA